VNPIIKPFGETIKLQAKLIKDMNLIVTQCFDYMFLTDSTYECDAKLIAHIDMLVFNRRVLGGRSVNEIMLEKHPNY